MPVNIKLMGIPVTIKPTGIPIIDTVVAEAAGHSDRQDPNLPHTGGPAGNARLTSWTGLLLLALIAAELITLLDVTGLIRWHVAIGILITALVLLKTASVCWRILRYYTRSQPYRRAGPPPLALRILGPLVIASTLGVLGSGIALIAIGSQASDRPMITLLGQSISPQDLHQALFILFAVVAGLHLLARFVPAVRQTAGRRGPDAANPPVAGRPARITVLTAAALAGVIALVLVLPSVTGWQDEDHHHDRSDNHVSQSQDDH